MTAGTGQLEFWYNTYMGKLRSAGFAKSAIQMWSSAAADSTGYALVKIAHHMALHLRQLLSPLLQ